MNSISRDASIKEQATAWLARRDRGFAGGEELEFERWRAADPRHGEALASLEDAWRILDHPREDGTADLFHADLRDLDRRRTRRRVVVGLSSACALACAALVWHRSTAPADFATREITAQVSRPELRQLPDGSTVELKRGAEIAVDYSGAFRRIALKQGEALFHVAHNRERPFIVTAGAVDVRAVGTAFTVDRGQTQVEVVVTEGRVSVDHTPASMANADPAAAAPPAALATLDAGHRLTVDLAPKPTAVPDVVAVPTQEMAERLAWRLPRLEFTDTTIAEAVALFNRNNRVQLRVEDRELARLRVTGVFRSDNIDGFVGLLESSFGVHATRSSESIALDKAR